MLAPVTHILPVTLIRRERLLPAPGKVLVRKGQTVAATDTIAEADLPAKHMLLDLVRGLGLPAAKADQQVKVPAGTPVSEGDLIAGPVGFPRRSVRAPKDGKVLLAGNGQVLLELKSSPFELKAGVPGEVVDLLPERGAVIQTSGALVQGVWGNGRVDFGLMYVLAKEPDHRLTADQLEVSLRGAVVLAGYCGDAATLKAAEELPIRALILSGMDTTLVPAALRLKIPLLLLDGFGPRPMNSSAFNLLTTNEQREAAVCAEKWDRYAGTRPELVIPLPASGPLQMPPETQEFTNGQKVRVLRAPHAGQIGTLEFVLPGKQTLPSGIRARAAQVRLENNEKALLPLANLEVLA